MAPEFGLREIAQIAVNVKDVERATRFYRDVLGMQYLFSAPPQMAFFQCGPVRLLLGVAQPGQDHPASILYYKVDDMRRAHQELVSRGVQFERDPAVIHRTSDMELWMAFFHDSESNLLAISCEVPVSAT